MEKDFYTFVVYHEKCGEKLGCRWHTQEQMTYEEAVATADRICERLQRGKKPNKRYGKLVHTKPTKEGLPF